MGNNNLTLQENEKFIKDLTILKLKKNFGFIKSDEYEEELIDIKLLGLATIDKFLSSITNDNIRLTIIQPNLMTTSIYETDIVSLLHQCEYNLI